MNTSPGNTRIDAPPSTGHVPTDGDTEPMAALVEAVADRRDRSAYIQLYTYFSPRVKSFLIGKGMTPAAADDVLQEVMLAVWQKAKLYRPARAAVSTWIFTIARNKYVDRLRREQRQPGVSDDPDLRAADTASATDEASREEKKIAVHTALSQLRPEQRDVVVLAFIKGLAHSEIAQRLDLPLGTVKSRIRMAFGHLRERLGDFRQLGEACFES